MIGLLRRICVIWLQKINATNTRSANDYFMLMVPPLSNHWCNTFFERYYVYGAPTEWNRLDERIRKLTDFKTFKSEIKTTLVVLYLDLFDIVLIAMCIV